MKRRRRKVARKRSRKAPPKRRLPRRKPARRKPLKRRKPPKRVKPPRPPERDEDDDDMGAEWEFGFEYDSLGGPNHDVDINFRVVRADGKKFSKSDAESVVVAFAESKGRLPHGYKIAAVNWKSPHKSSKRWRNASAMREVLSGALRNVLDAAGNQLELWTLTGLKMGNVK